MTGLKSWGFNLTRLTPVVGLLGLALSLQANASCMDGGSGPGPSVEKQRGSAHLVAAVFREADASAASFVRVSDEDQEGAAIVGLWQFKTDGFSPDWGTQAWHSDGTELMFSGAQNPETGDVCQGVWRKIGPSTYTLNHIAMGWTAPGAQFGVRVHFHFVVKLNAAGTKFTGTYKAAVYAVTSADPFDESVQLAAGGGNVTATRVNPD